MLVGVVLSFVTGLAALVTGFVARPEPRAPRPWAGILLGGLVCVIDGCMMLVVFGLLASGDMEDSQRAERQGVAAPPRGAPLAGEMSTKALFDEWSHDNAATDARYRGAALGISGEFSSGSDPVGAEYLASTDAQSIYFYPAPTSEDLLSDLPRREQLVCHYDGTTKTKYLLGRGDPELHLVGCRRR